MALDPARSATRLAVRRALSILRADDGQWWSPELNGVLVACSGGADSLALLAAAVFETRRVVGVTVDHGLQEDSAAHTSRVVAQMAALGVDETASIRVTVDPGPAGIEAGAREARYAALSQMAAHFEASYVVLGHTLDDQAETVLLGLTRGSGGRSLQGMRHEFDEGARFVRPFLSLTRAQTEAACRADGIEWWNDPHNEDPRFLRSRVRHSVMPLLERELGPGIAAALARTGEQLRDDMDVIELMARAAYERARLPDGIDLDEIDDVGEALQTRCIRMACLDAGTVAEELTRDHVLAVGRLLGTRGRKEVQLPGHVTAYGDPAEGSEILRFRRTKG